MSFDNIRIGTISGVVSGFGTFVLLTYLWNKIVRKSDSSVPRTHKLSWHIIFHENYAIEDVTRYVQNNPDIFAAVGHDHIQNDDDIIVNEYMNIFTWKDGKCMVIYPGTKTAEIMANDDELYVWPYSALCAKKQN